LFCRTYFNIASGSDDGGDGDDNNEFSHVFIPMDLYGIECFA
jgi:hypothetical protein